MDSKLNSKKIEAVADLLFNFVIGGSMSVQEAEIEVKNLMKAYSSEVLHLGLSRGRTAIIEASKHIKIR